MSTFQNSSEAIALHLSKASPYSLTQPMTLIIEDSGPFGDNSCVFLSQEAIDKYSLEMGETVYINCPLTRKQTIAVVVPEESIISPMKIRMNHICRKNLAATVGDTVTVKIFSEAVELDRVVVGKIGGTASTATPQKHQQNTLIDYFNDVCRPICQDDIFEVKTKMGTMEFFIKCTQPSIFGYVTPNTMIAIDWQEQQL